MIKGSIVERPDLWYDIGMNISDKIKDALGINKKDEYVRDYMESTNMRAMKYMCAFVIFVETWMIARTIDIILFDTEPRSAEWIAVHMRLYIILIVSSILMMWYAATYERGRHRDHITTTVWKAVYCFICINFGIYVSYLDYVKGEQIMSFITMILFVACLLVWPPWVSIILLSVSFGVFYYACDSKVPATVATDVNMFTVFVAMLMISIGNYRQRLSEAVKDKGLEDISLHDDLTGIYNMHHFRKAARKRLQEAAGTGRELALIYFDIVNFKTFNERYGFTGGNELLVTMANGLSEIFPHGLCARLSDDHFIVLTDDDDPGQKVTELLGRLTQKQRDVYLSLKAGIYMTDGSTRTGYGQEDINILCDRARFAVKSIKHSPETFCFFDEHLHEIQRKKHYVVSHIDSAIENGYIRVYYQLIMDAKTGKPCALEALARWIDPERGLISPGEFIETLEEYRQIHKLDLNIIEMVCRDFRDVISKWDDVVPVSVNLSRLDFELCDVDAEIDVLTAKYNVPAKYIEIEITESALSRNTEELNRAISGFRKSGYNLWLDDFGSGYSSFNVLKDYSFDVLKIDMKFLEDFGANERFEPIMRSIIGLCEKLGMISLAEGVETQEEYEFLKKCGCGRVQGYLFRPPVPIEELQEIFKKS